MLGVDRNDYSSILNFSSGGVPGFVLEADADGTSLVLFWWNAGWYGGGTTVATLSVGAPFFWALTGGASSARVVHISTAGVLSSYTTSSQTDQTLSSIRLMALHDGSEWWNGSVENVMVYDRVLSDDELKSQMWSRMPQSTQNLNAWWPLLSHADLNDYSGNGRNLTAGGTLSTEVAAPIAWGRGPSRIFIPASGAPAPSYAFPFMGNPMAHMLVR